MSIWNYKAINAQGKVRRGRMTATNIDELYMRIDSLGLDLLAWREVPESRFSLFNRKSITRRDIIDFCLMLEQLLSAGIPLMDSLDDLKSTTKNPSMREMISGLLNSIQEGQTLSMALSEWPKVFGETFVSLVEAGEQSGQLPTIFRSLGETLKWEDELIARAKKAVTYPSIVALVVLGAVTMLMVYLVPQLVSFIENMEGELPAHTLALLATSDFFVNYWYVVLGMPIALIILLRLARAYSQQAALWIDGNILKLPLIGDVLLKVMLARFCKTFALMYQSGITLLQIISVLERTVGNQAAARAINDIHQQLNNGTSLTDSFDNTGFFPPLVLRMVAIGERSGDLDTAMLNVSYFFDRDVNELLGKLESSLEPALTVMMGIILGWIMLSVLGPIYDLMTTIG